MNAPLTDALTRWRRTRDFALADEIDRLAAQHAAKPPVTDWLAISDRHRPEELPWLLEHLTAKARNPKVLGPRIASLVKWPDDPRMTAPLIALVVKCDLAPEFPALIEVYEPIAKL